jgi:hypothetical protein
MLEELKGEREKEIFLDEECTASFFEDFGLS